MSERPKIHPLIAGACVVVILAGLDAAITQAREQMHMEAAVGKVGAIEDLAWTSGEAAHVVLTNLTSATLYQCVRAVVRRKSDGTQQRSVPVCSGDLKPHTTTSLDAPYPWGTVKDLCAGKPDSFGVRALDWDLCTFDLEPATVQ